MNHQSQCHSHLSFVPSVRQMAVMYPQHYHREGGSVCGLTVVAARHGRSPSEWQALSQPHCTVLAQRCRYRRTGWRDPRRWTPNQSAAPLMAQKHTVSWVCLGTLEPHLAGWLNIFLEWMRWSKVVQQRQCSPPDEIWRGHIVSPVLDLSWECTGALGWLRELKDASQLQDVV